MTVRPNLSILIPCYNEQDGIDNTVKCLHEKLSRAGFSFEILCVNNNSTDQTEQVLLRLSKTYEHVRYVNTPPIAGYGVAVRWGLEFYSGDSVVIVMADGSETPEDIIAFYRKIEEGFDCAFGNRFMPGAEVVDYPRFKLFLNRLGNKLIAWVIGVDYGDFTNGFKCYRREVIDSIKPLFAEGFNLTIEMSLSTVLAKARFAVIPNSWKNRSVGTSQFKIFKQAKLYLMTLAYCWIRARIQGKSGLSFRHALARALGDAAPPRQR